VWTSLLVACGSRSQLPGGAEGQPGFGGNGTTAGAATLPASGGGKPMSGGAGRGVTGGRASVGGAGFGGLVNGGGRPSFGGTPLAGQGGSSAGTPGNEGGAASEPQPGDVLWGKRFGDEHAQQFANAIAVESSGVFTLTGGLVGKADFGSGTVGDDSDLDLFVAQFNGDGSPRWDAHRSNAGSQEGRGVAVAPDGVISVVGSFSGALDFGGGALLSGGNNDAFLLSLDHDGQYRAAARYGDNDNQLAVGVAASTEGQQVWAGYFRSTLDFQDHVVTSSGSVDAIVAGLDRQGTPAWDVSAGNVLAQRANAIAHAAGDNTFYVAGEMQGMLKLGACSQLVSKGETDAWIGWLDIAGNCRHSLRIGDASAQTARAVAAGKAGLSTLLAVVGDFSGTIETAGGSITAIDDDAFVLVLAADQNTFSLQPQWIRRIGGSGAQSAHAVAFDEQDNVIVVGSYTGDVNDPPLAPLGNAPSNAFVVKYDAFGDVVWNKSFGDDEVQDARAVGTDAGGNVFVTGQFFGSIPLATGTLTSAGADDLFVLKLAP
jgi:hypothetical protein